MAGGLLPALAALATVPVLIAQLGEPAYGALVLVLSLVGYAALLDLNVGTAATRFIAQHLAVGDGRGALGTLGAGMAVSLSVGLLGAMALWLGAEPLVHRVFDLPQTLAPQATAALRWAAAGFVISQVQGALQGSLHALQRFDLASRAEAGFGTAASVAALLAALLTSALVPIVIARVAVSALHALWLARTLRRLMPGLWASPLRLGSLRELAGFSAYSYLSRIASSTAAHGDKLVVGALVDVRALVLYAVPFMLVLRAFGMAYRLSQVMFPLASALAAQQRTDTLRSAYLDASRGVSFVNAALALWLAALAPEWLHYWLQPGGAATIDAGWVSTAATVMGLLVIGAAADSLTQLPSLVNDALGRPHITGFLAVARAAVGLAAVALGAQLAGVVGAAAAQMLVGALAAASSLWLLHRLSVPATLVQVLRQAWAPSLPLLLILPLLVALSAWREVLAPGRFALCALALACALALYGWCAVLRVPQRERVLRRLRLTLAPARAWVRAQSQTAVRPR